MESAAKGYNLWAMFMIAMALGFLILAPKGVESAFGIEVNPCTLPACIAACKKVLKDKFLSASCVDGPKGKYCICLG